MKSKGKHFSLNFSKLLLRSIFSTAVLFSSLASAAPDAKSTAEFVDYYFNGQGETPILAKMKFCHRVGIENEETKHLCLDDYTGLEMDLNEKVVIWMQFAAPEGTKIENLSLEMTHADQVLQTMPLSIEGSIRYRTYKAFKPSKAGRWKAKVFYNPKGEEKIQLGEMKINVGTI